MKYKVGDRVVLDHTQFPRYDQGLDKRKRIIVKITLVSNDRYTGIEARDQELCYSFYEELIMGLIDHGLMLQYKRKLRGLM